MEGLGEIKLYICFWEVKSSHFVMDLTQNTKETGNDMGPLIIKGKKIKWTFLMLQTNLSWCYFLIRMTIASVYFTSLGDGMTQITAFIFTAFSLLVGPCCARGRQVTHWFSKEGSKFSFYKVFKITLLYCFDNCILNYYIIKNNTLCRRTYGITVFLLYD